ncbi:28 kDa A-kinase anchor [Toxoplasma gondii TgCatPRC2]|uniref:28 kDa A-kinase anchor n=1 Tax=Toxoplasma gondii TgCatPRC2 TaxID=1130821 RepID=A0A151HFV4_TOXGO|nr:28 kDa A-kinase anchor [Toxoplasma gondii TgCatPRC2]
METVKEALAIPRLTLLASADSLVQTGRTYLADLVKNYTSKYEYSVQFVERNPADDLFFFRVTFSSPTPEKPVPEAEAHVHFQLKGWFLKNMRTSQLTGRDLQDVEAAVGKSPLIAEKPDKEPPIVFWFESQNLKHTPERTLAPGKFQRWIDRIVQDKLRLRRQNTMRTA